MKRTVSSVVGLALLLLELGCEQEPQTPGPKYGVASPDTATYHFAVHPLHNPTKLIQDYQPLLDYLNAELNGARLSLEASRDYANFEEKYQDRKPEFLLPNPWQTLQAMKAGYSVIAMAGEPNDFKGIFIVRRDSDIREPFDLKGKAVSYPSPTALAACIMPQYFLHTHGVDINRDIENCYVGSQESSIMNVSMQKTVAGATWPPPWRSFQKEYPAEAAELKVLWETEPLINNSVMIRDDIPVAIRQQVQTLLVGLHESEQGKAILANMETARFIAATDQDYEVVRVYVERFEREVRAVERK
ncbi:MAG: phosphonate ABC transporter substrate-binding protein [Desulfobulbaceae bacterium A2]|nr:MAG: phosphonate ABC transporter substrate-binding protein [Desulfobulbaceae bacterium A2]